MYKSANIIFGKLKKKYDENYVISYYDFYEKNHNLISNDYQDALNSLQDGQRRFANGIYLLWHPIIEGDERNLTNFYQ